MNRLKQAIADLKNYLGSDRRAIDLLNVVSRHANEIRKESSSKEEELMVLREKCRTMEKSLEELNAERVKSNQRLIQLDAQVVQLQRDVVFWKQAASPKQEETMEQSKGNIGDKVAMRNVMRSLSREIRFCPPPQAVVTISGRRFMDRKDVVKETSRRKMVYMYDICDIVPDLSPNSLLTLGRFAVVMAASGFYAILTAEEELVAKLNDKKQEPEDGSYLGRFIGWFAKKNLDSRSNAERLDDRLNGEYYRSLYEAGEPE